MKKLKKDKMFYIFQGEQQLKTFMEIGDKYTLYKMPEKYPIVMVGEQTDKGEHFLRKIVDSDVPFMRKIIQNAENNLDKQKNYYAQVMETAKVKEGTRYAELRDVYNIKTTFPYHHSVKVKLESGEEVLFVDKNGVVVKRIKLKDYHHCGTHSFYTVYVTNELWNTVCNNEPKKEKKNEHTETSADNKA